MNFDHPTGSIECCKCKVLIAIEDSTYFINHAERYIDHYCSVCLPTDRVAVKVEGDRS